MRYQTIAPAPFDLYTGGKHPDLSIAFNLASDNTEKFINSLMNWDPAKESLKSINELDDKTFVYLRQYLWKGNSENKNTAGYALEPADKSIIISLLKKLVELRNFHSHYWHENKPVEFNTDLQRFIQHKHDWAVNKLLEVKSIDSELYLRLQDRFPLFKENRFITQEGRVFFLSFFLNKGQMQYLLQQRKGSKRHDLPEFKFKHKVFTYYCHREGAAWLSTGIENKNLPTLEEVEKKRISDGRQANRILSYLKDIPLFHNEAILPLFLSSGQKVENIETLLDFITETNMLPGIHFKAQKREDTYQDADLPEANEQQKHQEKLEREGYRRFTLIEHAEYEFEISYAVLRRIVTAIVLDNNDPERESNKFNNLAHFLGVLRDCIDTRRYFYENLKSQNDAPIHPQVYALKKLYSSIYINYKEEEGSIQERYYTGNEWRNIPISPTLKTEKLLIQWHNSFTLGKENEPVQRARLLNAIRPNTEVYQEPMQPFHKNRLPPSTAGQDPEPLLFHLAYYFREQDTNIRTEDKFLEWGARYLMDMNLVPDWHFEMEQLVYEQKFNQPESQYKLKKTLRWEKNIPENYRLNITDNQLNIGIWKEERLYRLRLGERVLKYILYRHFHSRTKETPAINDLLLTVVGDLALLHKSPAAISPDQFQLLEPFAIPPLYFKTKVLETTTGNKTPESYKEQARKFISEKIKWLETQLALVKRSNRSQKNKLLLDAYRLFDFSDTEGRKFLRKNEYQQMSICHYMLNQDKGKIRDLIEKTFRLKKRIPAEILQIIYKVISHEEGNLDALCIQVLGNRKDFLKAKLRLLNHPNLKTKHIRNEIVESMDIYFDDHNLAEEELAVRNHARLDSLSHLPFAIHPALALKYFYPESFAANKFCKEGGEYQNIFLALRSNNTLTAPLPKENYRESAYKKIFTDYQSAFPQFKELGQAFKKTIGLINDSRVKDIFLLQIAEKYLEAYDAHMTEQLRQVKSLKQMDLKKMFRVPAIVQISIDQSILQQMDAGHKQPIKPPIYLELRLHQLDDYFYRSEKMNLQKLAFFYLHWRREELERYASNPEIIQSIQGWPDGSHKKPLTIGTLIEARRIIADQAAELAGYIFNYEAGILNGQYPETSKVEKQKLLIDYSKANETGQYISFSTILSWDKDSPDSVKEQIRQLRNNCLHNLIPVNGSYRKQSMPGSDLAVALQIDKPLGRDRTEPNIYEMYAANEVEKGE